jgi:hypothetical protein
MRRPGMLLLIPVLLASALVTMSHRTYAAFTSVTTTTGTQLSAAQTYANVVSTSGAAAHWRLGDTGSMILSKDTFINTSGVSVYLEDHTGDVAGDGSWTTAAWTKHSSVYMRDTFNSVARRTNAGHAVYYIGVSLPADYAVEAKLNFPSNGVSLDRVGVLGRMTGDAFYWAGLSRDNSGGAGVWTWSIQEVNYSTGSWAQLGSSVAQTAPGPADNFVTRLEMVGSSLQLYVNGVPTIAATDSTLTGGSAGISDGVTGAGSKTDATGGTFDDFVVAPALATDSKGFSEGFYRSVPTLGQTGAIVGDTNKAVTFTGTNYAAVPDQAALDVGDTFSLEAWVKRSATQGTVQSIIQKGIGTAGFDLQFAADNKLTLAANGVTIVQSTTTQTDTSAFHHYVVTKTTGTAVKVYIDGIDRTGTVTSTVVADTASPLYIGAKNISQRFVGTIDEVAIYGTVLSPADVADHYEQGTGTRPAAFLAGTPTSNANFSFGNATTVTKPAGLADGELVVATISSNKTGTMTGPAGFTAGPSTASGGSSKVWTYYKVVTNAASEPASYSFTWTGATAQSVAWATRVTGANTTTPVETTTATGGGSSTTATVASATTSGPNRLLLAALAVDTTVTVTSASFSPLSSTAAGNWTGAFGVIVQPTTGATGAQTFTLSSSHSWATALLVIAPA